MSDVMDVAAPAASEGPSAPIDTPSSPTPQPLGSQTPVAPKPEAPAEKPAEKPAPKSTHDAIREANERVKAKLATEAKEKAAPAPKAEPKAPEPKQETAAEARARSEDGKFASKEPVQAKEAAPTTTEAPKPASPAREAPARFSPDAKAEWEAAPERVKAEVHRAIRELEDGHQKYKESAERFEKVREYDELARKNGREGVHESLKQVVELEQAFQRSPIEGFQKVADHFGISMRAVAAHIMGQDPQSTATQQDQTIQQLRAELQELKTSVGTITKSAEEQKTNEVMSKVTEFAQSKPRFDELASDIEFFLSSGRTKDLAEAYTLAERLNPAPSAPAPAPEPTPAPQPQPLSQAGNKSITGAPATGSDPALPQGPVPTSREALRKALNSLPR
jgi:hypothetical protein